MWKKTRFIAENFIIKAVSDDTKFDWVNGYEDFVNKFGVAESD